MTKINPSLRRYLTLKEVEWVKWMIAGISADSEKLAAKEIDTAISIEEQFNSDTKLSDKQLELLESLYKKSS